jgi:hypothetical protein
MTLGTSDTWPRLGLCSRGTLGHFRDQQERFCNGIPSEGGIEPLDPIKRDRVRQINYRYFLERASRPLADPYRTGHRRPLGSPVSNSLETPCSAPPEGNMALSPTPPCGKATQGRMKKAESVLDHPLALRGGSGVALANPAPAKPLTAST